MDSGQEGSMFNDLFDNTPISVSLSISDSLSITNTKEHADDRWEAWNAEWDAAIGWPYQPTKETQGYFDAIKMINSLTIEVDELEEFKTNLLDDNPISNYDHYYVVTSKTLRLLSAVNCEIARTKAKIDDIIKTLYIK